VRLGLVVFVLGSMFGPYALRSAVPIWLPFLIAPMSTSSSTPSARVRNRRPDRGPRPADHERYRYGGEAEALLLVREGARLRVRFSSTMRSERTSSISRGQRSSRRLAPVAARRRSGFVRACSACSTR
jgi:hypothetical protein